MHCADHTDGGLIAAFAAIAAMAQPGFRRRHSRGFFAMVCDLFQELWSLAERLRAATALAMVRCSFMSRPNPLRCWPIVGLLAALCGCQTFDRHRPTFWPFPERKLTTYHTPSMRVDAMQEFGMRSIGVDSPEQREITDQLVRQIQVEPDPLVRQAIVKAAAEYRTPMAQQLLEAGLKDENSAVRTECCRALGRRAEPASVASLAGVLTGEKDTDVKMAATEALGKIKSPESVKALAVALDDRDPAMQYVGVQSMKTATGKDYGPDVQAWRQVASGGTPPPEVTPSIADRIRQVTPFTR